MGIFIFFVCAFILTLDILGKINVMGRIPRFLCMLFLPQVIILCWAAAKAGKHGILSFPGFAAAGIVLLYTYLLVRIHLFPVRRVPSCTRRIKILLGGKIILSCSLWGFLMQGIFYILLFTGHLSPLDRLFAGSPLLYTINVIHSISFLFLILLNGQARILFTCYRLGIVRRLLIVLNLWIPFINLFLMHYLGKKAAEECDHEMCRFSNRAARANSNQCATKYPLVMLHGIGFRDLRYFNYWGRIPKELTRNGAVVYYGHQEAWGTIEENAAFVQHKIEEILAIEHCEKVNIIAHSKGGLDARYLITHLHMEQQVASLTTVSTPHMGSELLLILNRIPDRIYRLISSRFDSAFRKIGDCHPDCYHASKQLSPEFCRQFNQATPNSDSVYYQSYASVMRHCWSDSLLSIPHLFMGLASHGKPNDGLVTEDSAKWGISKETFQNKYRRGISHGDMIDLKREDYKGFDVIETYVDIVTDLKNMGF